MIQCLGYVTLFAGLIIVSYLGYKMYQARKAIKNESKDKPL